MPFATLAGKLGPPVHRRGRDGGKGGEQLGQPQICVEMPANPYLLEPSGSAVQGCVQEAPAVPYLLGLLEASGAAQVDIGIRGAWCGELPFPVPRC